MTTRSIAPVLPLAARQLLWSRCWANLIAKVLAAREAEALVPEAAATTPQEQPGETEAA